MRSSVITISLAVTLAGCAQREFEALTVEFAVPDMMCEEGCAATVTEILSRQPGVTDVRVEFEAKKATVAIEEGRFDPQLALAALVDKGFENSTLKDGTDTKLPTAPPSAE
jgi:copper chaperone CopZ